MLGTVKPLLKGVQRPKYHSEATGWASVPALKLISCVLLGGSLNLQDGGRGSEQNFVSLPALAVWFDANCQNQWGALPHSQAAAAILKMAPCTGKGGYQCPFASETTLRSFLKQVHHHPAFN